MRMLRTSGGPTSVNKSTCVEISATSRMPQCRNSRSSARRNRSGALKSSGAFHAYFGRNIRQGQVYFVYLKTPEIARQHKDDIYEIRTREGRRTTLLYHELYRIEECVGKLLYDFIRSFTAYLASYGIASSSKERTFSPFLPPKGQAHLLLVLLNPIYVYVICLPPDRPEYRKCVTLSMVIAYMATDGMSTWIPIMQREG
jgi:hypothetical protein